MDESVMRNHIQLYVNDFSVDLGPVGREAITTLYNKGVEKSIFPALQSSYFVE
jgi:1,4-dihydroxy-6-naphthoate synthase